MNLNKTLLIAAMALLTMSLSAQQSGQNEPEDGMQYLLQEDLQISGFGGVIVDYTTIENEPSVSVGGGGAAMLNQRFFLGGYGQGVATIHERENMFIDNEHIEDAVFQFGHGGIWLGYIIEPSRVLHMNINTKLGAGELALRKSLDEYEMMDSYHKDRVTVINPSIGLNVNILPWFRITANVGYRFIGGVGDKTYDDSNQLIFDADDYNAPTFSFSFLFGGFK